MQVRVNFPSKKLDIIKASLDLFLENGYEQTKVSQIMKATHLSKGGMYHYFDSKEAILDAVIEYAFIESLEGFADKLATASNTFEKMALFLDNNILLQTEFSTKFSTLVNQQKNTLVYYRVREFSAIFAVPILRNIINFGSQAGVFHTDFPEEITTVLFCAGDLFFRDIANLEEQAAIETKIEAFVDLIEKTLAIKPQDTLILKEIITQQALRRPK